MRRFFALENLGCAKNRVDAESIGAILRKKGWKETSFDDAYVIILNTCGFIESAKKESINRFFELNRAFPNKKIVLAGCLSQRYGEELKKAVPEAAGVFGSGNVALIGEFLQKVEKEASPVWLPPASPPVSVDRSGLLTGSGTCYIKIAEGCAHRCRFCAIPLIKGRVMSRTIASITKEIAGLVDVGVIEFNLVAQDTTTFGRDRGQDEFIRLLRSISKLSGDFIVRSLYLYPDNFPADLLDIMAEDERFIPYFDLPVQHASEAVLRKMGRVGNAEMYLDLIASIRARFPLSAIRTTFMVGFPGETERDFEILREFQEKARVEWMGAFAYSREEGTAAYKEAGSQELRVLKRVANARLVEIMEAQQSITCERLSRFTGKTMRAIVDETIDAESGLYLVRPFMCAPEVDGVAVLSAPGRVFTPGDRVNITITGATGVDFKATLAS